MNPSESGGIVAAVMPTRAVMRTSRRELAAWAVAGLAFVGLIGVLAFRGRPQAEGDGERVYRATIPLPEQGTLLGEDPARIALSPDGRRLAFVAAIGDGRSMLWVRALDGLIAQPLAGTEGALNPFWSPDSQFIGFIQRSVDVLATVRGQLKKVPAGGGLPVTIATVNFTASASWNRDNVILFTPAGNSSLHRVPAEGGDAVPATTLDAASGEVQHSFPHFLPDGRHFLYSAVGSAKGGATDVRAVFVGSLDSNERPRLILERSSNAMYANGHLVFVRGGTLLAQPFDADRLQLRGEPMALAERVLTSGTLSGAFSVSANGILVYQTTPPHRSQLAWFDRSGVRQGNLGDQADYVDVVLSPNGARAAVSVMEPEVGTRDIWIFDAARGLRERFTTTQSDEFAPVWSPRGDRLAYSSTREGNIDIYQKTTGGAEQRLGTDTAGIGKYAASWSPDERAILYIGGGRIIARSDLMLLPLEGDRRPKPYLDSEFVETQGRFSPDGRWIAYSSNHTGRMEVYVRPYPGPGEPERVSDSGGQWAQWRRDGTELFFIRPDNMLMAAAVGGQGSALQVKASSAAVSDPYASTGKARRVLLRRRSGWPALPDQYTCRRASHNTADHAGRELAGFFEEIDRNEGWGMRDGDGERDFTCST